MITVVCLSPSLDQTIELSGLCVGGTNRELAKRTAAGGKGLNVAVTLAKLGQRVCLATYRHEQNSALLMEAIRRAQIDCAAVDVPGALRTNIKLLDRTTQTVTEVNAQSELVPEAAQAQMRARILEAARGSEWLVLTGSMPKGYPADAYAELIRLARVEAPHCRIALDAEGETFRLGVQQGPDLVKPNRFELEQLTGRPLKDDRAVIDAAKALIGRGVGTVVVSMDQAGCVLVAQERVLRAEAVSVPVVTTVGAGDALVSGLLSAWHKGEEQALRAGVAAATARVAGRDGESGAYLPRVKIREQGSG